MLPLLLALLWAGEWPRGGREQPWGSADPRFSAGSLAQDDRHLLIMQESVTVQEGLCVFVPCAFSIPEGAWTNASSVDGYWFRERGKVLWNAPVATSDPTLPVQEEAKGRFHLLGDPEASNCSLDIRDAWRNDTGTYVFRVLRGNAVKYTYDKKPLAVHVTGKAWVTERTHGRVLMPPGTGLNAFPS